MTRAPRTPLATMLAIDGVANALARQRLGGVTVTTATTLAELRARSRPGMDLPLLGPAALLARAGGPFADPGCVTLFDGWQRVFAADQLRGAEQIASRLAPSFEGTVGDLEIAVAGILATGR